MNRVKSVYRSAKEKVNHVIDNATGQVMVAGATGLTLAGNANAAVPEGVTTAISTAVTDVGTIGGAVILIVVAVAAWAWMRRPIK